MACVKISISGLTKYQCLWCCTNKVNLFSRMITMINMFSNDILEHGEMESSYTSIPLINPKLKPWDSLYFKGYFFKFLPLRLVSKPPNQSTWGHWRWIRNKSTGCQVLCWMDKRCPCIWELPFSLDHMSCAWPRTSLHAYISI